MIELVDFNEIYGKTANVATEPAKKTRRGRPKKSAETTEAVTTTETALAEPAATQADTTSTETKAAE
jgi:large subunit ribosomal protein L17